MRENVTLKVTVPAGQDWLDVTRKLVGPDLCFELVRKVRSDQVEVVVFGNPAEVEAFVKTVGA